MSHTEHSDHAMGLTRRTSNDPSSHMDQFHMTSLPKLESALTFGKSIFACRSSRLISFIQSMSDMSRVGTLLVLADIQE